MSRQLELTFVGVETAHRRRLLVFDALLDGRRRRVTVLAGRTLRFPHPISDGGMSLGDPGADREVHRRASEVEAILQAAVELAAQSRGGRRAA